MTQYFVQSFARDKPASDACLDLNAQRDHNDVLRQYRDTLVRRRRATLAINTAVGVRLLP